MTYLSTTMAQLQKLQASHLHPSEIGVIGERTQAFAVHAPKHVMRASGALSSVQSG